MESNESDDNGEENLSLCQYHLGAPPRKSTSGVLLTRRKQLPHADDAAKAGRPDDMKEARKTSKLGTDSVALETGDSFGFSRLSPEDTDFKMPLRTPQDLGHLKIKTLWNNMLIITIPPARAGPSHQIGLATCNLCRPGIQSGRRGCDNSTHSFLPAASDSAASSI